MAMITTSEYGIVAVNNTVLSKMIIDDMLMMNEELIPCNKRGKALRKGFFTGYNEFYNSVELNDDADGVRVKVYYISMTEGRFEETSEKLFDMIESDFEMLCLDKPLRLTANIRGVMKNKSVDQKDIEMVRRNDK